MCSFKSIYFVIFVLNLYKTNAQISDKRLCVDADCKEPVSLAKTLLRYSSPDPRLLSFAPNEQITIYSKEAGSQLNLWGAEIRGKRGYVPKNLVREYKVFKKPQLLVDTELKHKSQVPLANKEKVDPDAVQKAFEVVDGTTIYINPQDSINPSSTESPIQPTAVPPGSKTTEGEAEASIKPVDESQEESSLKETIPESVVNNVLSTISNYWMKDDTKETDGSEEGEDPEDDDDFEDDEDEDEEEEDSIEENDLTDAEKQNEAKNESTLQKSQDPDLLHNLPLGVTLSTYSFEEGPISSKESGVSKEIPPQQEIASNEAVINPASIPVTTELKGPGNIEAKTDSNLKPPPPISTVPSLKILDPLVFEKKVVPEEKLGIETSKESESPEPKVITELPSSSVIPDSTTEAPKDNIVDAPDILPEITTVPTPFDEEQVPYVDEVTPNPLNTKTEEVSPEKDEKSNEDQASQLPTQQQTEENQSQNVGSVESSGTTEQTSDHLQNNSVLPFKEEPIATDEMKSAEVVEESGTHVVKDQEVPVELPSPPPLGGFYNPVQNMLNPNIVEEKQQIPSENLNDPAKDTGGSKEENEASKESQILTETVETQSSVEASDAEQKENLINSIESDTSKEEPTSSEDVKVSDRVEEQSTENLDDVTVTGNNNLEDSREDNSMVQNTDQDTQNKDVYYEDSKEYNSEVKNIDEPTPNEDSNNNEGPKANSGEVTNVEEVAPSKETVNYGDSTEAEGGIFSNILSWFGSNSEEPEASSTLSSDEGSSKPEEVVGENLWPTQSRESVIEYCDASIETCNTSEEMDLKSRNTLLEDIELSFNSDIFVYLLTTSISVIVFLFGYMLLDRSRRESPLIARINKLEKELLVTMKEKELLEEKGPTLVVQETGSVPNEVLEEMTQRLADVQLANSALELKVQELTVELEGKQALEEQVESLEKELEISTEVGMELNRIISEMLDPRDGSERLKENMEQLQRQLLEQKDTINTISVALKEKESENQLLESELEKGKKKVGEFQAKLDEMVDRVLKIEREKDQQQNTLQSEIVVYQQKYSEAVNKVDILNSEIQILRVQLAEFQRQAEIKTKEYQSLQDSLDKIKSMKNDKEALRSLLDVTSIKAELQQLKAENETYTEQLQNERTLKIAYEKKYGAITEEVNLLHEKYELADKEKVEANSRLEVLNNYFKKREAELQEEVIKYKSIWETKEGETTSTTERIKHMQEEVENYKAQNEALKDEIISQEIDLKSKISMLEKKVHENWVTARQTERKLEDARQEAAQLRNRLTLRERAINEERTQNRLQSPLEQNGELPLSPHPIDSPASPPLLYGRDHITKSPPLPGLPPFLPPPLGGHFMPPPLHGMPPFMPPPPTMFPGDHRPPPLGRMSSPPLNSRYSPDTSAFSPYDRNSPSPPYDSEYGTSPPPIRGYSPYNSRDDRRDYKRPPHVRTNGRNTKGSVISSGSEHSNDSLDKVNRKQSKMV